jgi:hypothetical protein
MSSANASGKLDPDEEALINFRIRIPRALLQAHAKARKWNLWLQLIVYILFLCVYIVILTTNPVTNPVYPNGDRAAIEQSVRVFDSAFFVRTP